MKAIENTPLEAALLLAVVAASTLVFGYLPSGRYSEGLPHAVNGRTTSRYSCDAPAVLMEKIAVQASQTKVSSSGRSGH